MRAPLQREHTDDQADLTAAAAHDRRHGLPQHVTENAEGLRRCKLCQIPLAVAGQDRARSRSRLSPAPCVRIQGVVDQSDRRRTAHANRRLGGAERVFAGAAVAHGTSCKLFEHHMEQLSVSAIDYTDEPLLPGHVGGDQDA